MDTAQFASDIWSAELREVSRSGWEYRKRMLLSVAGGIFGAFTGAPVAPSLADLVILDRTDGTVVHSTPAGEVDDAPGILQTARDELDVLTPAQFASEWGFAHS
jgi:hypothetical protein